MLSVSLAFQFSSETVVVFSFPLFVYLYPSGGCARLSVVLTNRVIKCHHNVLLTINYWNDCSANQITIT